MERLFFAVAPPPDARRALARHLAAALPGGLPGRLVPEENWHLTLRFLGSAGPEQRAALERALSAQPPGGPFTAVLGTLGAFPRPRQASTLWVGISEGASALERLAEHAEAAARMAGFGAETRPFHPHLTLSRLRPPLDLAPLVQRVPSAGIALPVRAVVLFRSVLGSGAPRYESVREWPLFP
jgi:RNA 2',3'-cyclic 3'-phosphodiesterase